MQSRGGGEVSSREQRSRARSRRGGVSENWITGSPLRAFFSDTDSDSDSDEAFQISRKLGLVHVEFFCVLVQQPCLCHSCEMVSSFLYKENALTSALGLARIDITVKATRMVYRSKFGGFLKFIFVLSFFSWSCPFKDFYSPSNRSMNIDINECFTFF